MMADKPAMSQDWKEVPRSKMFERVILAVDSARATSEAAGDEQAARYYEEQLFPFLEAQMLNAEVEEAAEEELAAAIGVRKLPELSDEEKAEGWRLIRRSDAFGLMRLALQGNTIINDDRENALNELRALDEDATNKLREWQRSHGLSE